MSFSQMTLKMFRENIRKYVLYFLCSTFSIMIFFTYASLFTNSAFTNSYNIDSSISSMIIAPTIGVVFFSIFFIIYAHNSFIKERKREFGIFMVLGMTNRDIGKLIIIENSVIAFSSLVTGILLGSLFSVLFYYVTNLIIDVGNIKFSLSIKSYLYSFVFFVCIYMIVIISSIITVYNYKIIQLIKETRNKEKNLVARPIFGILGLILIIVASMYLLLNSSNKLILLRSIVVNILGIYLIISNISWFTSRLFVFSKNKYSKSLIFLASLKYTLGRSKKVLFVITILVSITTFFCSVAVLLLDDCSEIAIKYNPYDVAYSQIYGRNNISEIELANIIKSSETPVTFSNSLKVIAKNNITILSDENLNSVIGGKFHINEGKFVNLFQIVEDDGYSHNKSEIRDLDIYSKNFKTKLISQGSITKVLFNNSPILAGHYVVINNSDFIKLQANSKPNEVGSIKLIKFKDWRKTRNVIAKLDDYMVKYNKSNCKSFYGNEHLDSKMFKTSSKIGDYLRNKQAASFLLFLLTFVGILFFVSAGVMLHFKMLTEYEREIQKFDKLYKIGATSLEIKRMILKELKVLFFLPNILGAIVGTLYISSMRASTIKKLIAMGYSLSITLVYLVLQLVFYVIYNKWYTKKLIGSIERRVK